MIKKLTKRFRRKTSSEVSAERVAIERMSRFNPLRNVSPSYIISVHEEFNAGRLRNAAKLWDAIERTDDVCQVSASKRKKAVSRHGYEIIKDDDSPEAEQHAESLRFFYDQLVATRCDDRNVRGGLPLLVRNMMDAEGKRYAAHEIVWIPVDGKLTAELIFVPLWYFENTQGELRLLKGLSDLNGEPLEPGGWLINSGSGIMESVAAAYMFKHLPLQDWLLYSEKFGMPIPAMECSGNPGDDNWTAAEKAVAGLSACDGVVYSAGNKLTFPTAGSAQNLPYPTLIERMDRAIASLWRGADLSTISKGDGTGASLQQGETDLLEDDDAANITDVLNEQIDKFVIKYMHGSNRPKAWVRIRANVREDVASDLKIDQGLKELGFASPIEALQRRYNRPDLEPLGTVPLANEMTPKDEKDMAALQKAAQPTDKLLKASRKLIAKAMQDDRMPIAERLAEIIDDTPDADLFEAIERFRSEELPALAEAMLTDPAAAKAFEDSMSAALLSGLAEGI